MVDTQKLSALLKFMFESVGTDLKAIVVVDRQGLVLASELKTGISEELIGGMSALVEPVLKRIASEFKSGKFGVGTFDTDENRLLFCEAGPQSIVVLVADAMGSIDSIFPYAYLFAEKVARIIDGRPVSPVIPKFGSESEMKKENKDLQQIVIEEGNFILKTVLLGAGGVGKTTLVQQFVDASFQDDYKATIGVSIMKKAISFPEWNVECRFTIFDMAGQAQFARVRQTYLQGAKAGFIVYDCTRMPTFEEVRRWNDEAKKAEPDLMLMLIANKVDLKDARVVTEAMGKAVAAELKIPYMEVSAINKEIVNEAFRALGLAFIQKYAKLKSVKNFSI
jgi:small GTP-binding protein